MDKEELVPLEQVLEDMYSDGYIAHAARDYYYYHYCTPEQRARLEKEDRICNIVAGIFIGLYGLLGLLAIIL